MEELKIRTNQLLVIGIDKYKSNLHNNLNNSFFDCESIIKELTENYNFHNIIEPIYNEYATRRNILDSLARLQYLILEEDNLIIYFAGHGSMNPITKKGYWVPYDAEESSSDYIPNGQIKDAIEDINAKHIFLISDSCFSGTFLSNSRGNIADKHYKNLDTRKSRWYLASGSNEKVSDGKIGLGSPFSNELLNCLRNNSNKHISVLEIITEVCKKTGNNSYQQPLGGEIKNTGHDYGQMVLTKSDERNEDNFQYKNDKLNKEQFGDLMKTYGFYIGQKRTLDMIERKFPKLKADILITNILWNSSFESSVNNILDKIKEILKDNWGNYEKLLLSHLDTNLSEDLITYEDAIDFVSKINNRSKGDIPSPMIEYLLSYKPEFIFNPQEEYFKNYRFTLASANHPKAKGFDFSVEIPLSWSVNGGKRPNVLWMVSNLQNSVMVSFTVKKNKAITDLSISDDEWSQELHNQLADMQFDTQSLFDEIATSKSTNKISRRSIIDGCHVLIIEFEDEIFRSNIKIDFFCKIYFILFRDYTLQVTFHIDKNKINTKKEKEKYSLYFDLILSSLVVLSRYT